MRRFVRYLLSIIATAFMLIMVACQQEPVFDGPCEVRFVAEVQNEVNVTRADGYTEITEDPGYDAGLFVSYGNTALEYSLQWKGNALSADLYLEAGGYFFCGYAPQKDGVEFENHTNKLIINNVAGLTTEDLLVINPCSTTISLNDISAGGKTVSLQMDHLMAKVTPRFYINGEYAKLRDICITKVEFILDNAATYTATIDYSTTPYSKSWEGVVDDNCPSVEAVLFNAGQSTDSLSIEPVAYGECFLHPQQTITGNLAMRVTYDVYDKHGTKVRPGQTAVNKIKKLPATLVAGTNYILNVQIVPTYLYVLSDDDEDSVLIIKD